MQNSWKRHLPNVLTVMNLLSGCMATISVVNGQFRFMAAFVAAALIFDLLDGMVARALKVSSPFGKELDSLADMVTFGVVPGVALYWLFMVSNLSSWVGNEVASTLAMLIPFLVTAFSALRLAKFNLDTRQSDYFIGLPTPANTLWIVSLPLILENHPGEFDFILREAVVLFSLTLISCWLLVAEIPMLSFKMKSFSPQTYPAQFLLASVAILLSVLFSYLAAPLIILFYVLLSVIVNYRTRASS